jgi:hypothetical protein
VRRRWRRRWRGSRRRAGRWRWRLGRWGRRRVRRGASDDEERAATFPETASLSGRPAAVPIAAGLPDRDPERSPPPRPDNPAPASGDSEGVPDPASVLEREHDRADGHALPRELAGARGEPDGHATRGGRLSPASGERRQQGREGRQKPDRSRAWPTPLHRPKFRLRTGCAKAPL